ncbi:MAG: HAD-IIB family hydrolase [Clostridia bacterium]|nr:HAD-IIB family hydrolase [Clostridia bacterium]
MENIKEYINIHQTSIFKLVISSTEALSNLKEEILSKFDVNVTLIQKKGFYKDKIIDKEYEYLDITPLHIGKGYALEYLSRFLNLERSDVMAIGDNINDIDMIQMSGTSATLSDSYEEVKKVASYVTTNTSENAGFAEAVYKFI